ncbi:MAG: hypothetical protein JST01_29565 [Cyanobacteria bacterium SZAS TMP-1]|nr:hypothetical protein [Cyanobacteria bacterium SZAS TMP-1]
MEKLPQITLAFWIMKISATTLGETAGDLLSMTLKVGYAISCVILLSIFLTVLIIQLRSKSYHPFLYWSVILATSTAGTTMSDFMDRTLGWGYAIGSLVLVTALATILFVWRFTTGSLSVTNVKTVKDESFYWAAILVSNTLGTALGDYLADSSGLGFAGGAALIGGLIALVIAAKYLTNISRVLLFWIAFVLTRPFGATMGDLLTKTPQQGGLGVGTIGSSLVLLAILVALILWTYRKQGNGAAVNG